MSLYIPKMSDTPGVTIPGLASNFQALDGSQIVEWGSNENGTYWRWESGLQVCYIGPVDTEFANPSNLIYWWIYPAAFASIPRVYATGYYQAYSVKFLSTAHIVYSRDASSTAAAIGFGSDGAWVDEDQSLGDLIMGYAIGRWK